MFLPSGCSAGCGAPEDTSSLSKIPSQHPFQCLSCVSRVLGEVVRQTEPVAGVGEGWGGYEAEALCCHSALGLVGCGNRGPPTPGAVLGRGSPAGKWPGMWSASPSSYLLGSPLANPVRNCICPHCQPSSCGPGAGCRTLPSGHGPDLPPGLRATTPDLGCSGTSQHFHILCASLMTSWAEVASEIPLG